MLSCLFTEFSNLILRGVELQQCVVYTFRKFRCPQARRLVFREIGWQAFLGLFDHLEPLLVGISVRHIHAFSCYPTLEPNKDCFEVMVAAAKDWKPVWSILKQSSKADQLNSSKRTSLSLVSRGFQVFDTIYQDTVGLGWRCIDDQPLLRAKISAALAGHPRNLFIDTLVIMALSTILPHG